MAHALEQSLSGDLELSWASGKRRPKPQPLQAAEVEVSRESGLHSAKGTFGVSSRFSSKVVGRGRDSPNRREFYGRNQINKLPHEAGPSCSFGVGERPSVVSGGGPPRNVGPGSYDIVSSCSQRKSPLDGAEYCSTSMHQSLPSKLVPVDMCSPGPHHKYEVRRPLDGGRPSYHAELLSHGTRHVHPEDTDGPGLKNNDIHHLSVARNASCPSLQAGGVEARGTKRCLKTTFGTADRFRSGKQSTSPAGGMGYAHFKFPTSEDYLARSRSCSFGAGTKTDFSNPYRGHRSTVSPVSYSPNVSTVKKSSALDGFASRCASPVHSALKAQTSSMVGSPARSAGSPARLWRGRGGAGEASGLADTIAAEGGGDGVEAPHGT